MSRKWKPGDVAMVNDRVCIRTSRGWEHGDDRAFAFAAGDPNLDVRPLVVIDPEDREQVERLAYLLDWAMSSHDQPRLAAALREFANPTPPKPDEPLGLGAVVLDARGYKFVRMHDGWWRGEEPCTVNWSAVQPVEVLSEGVRDE